MPFNRHGGVHPDLPDFPGLVAPVLGSLGVLCSSGFIFGAVGAPGPAEKIYIAVLKIP